MACHVRHASVFLWAIALAACGIATPQADSSLDVAPIDASVGDGEGRHRLLLGGGRAVRVLLEQGDTDLRLTITATDAGARVIDRRERGTETAQLIADRPATFTIAVARVAPIRGPAPPSRYRIRLETPPGPVEPLLQQRLRAEELESTGKRLAAERTAESRRSALEHLRAAADLWADIDVESRATSLARMGDILLALGELEPAHAAYLSALPAIPPGEQAAILHQNIGVVLGRQGFLSQSEAHFRIAREGLRTAAAPTSEALAMVSEGSALFEMGRYRDALARSLAATRILEEHGHPGKLLAMNNAGVTYRALGDVEAARLYLARVVTEFPSQDESGLARARIRLGQIALDLGDGAAAAASGREALAVLERAGDALGAADAHLLMGRVAALDQQLRQALDHFDRARFLYEQRGARSGAATALHHRAAVLTALGDDAAGRQSLAAALRVREEVGLPDPAAQSHHELGRAYWRAGDAARALHHLRRAIALTEEVRGRLAHERSRATFLAARRAYFITLIDALLHRAAGSVRHAPYILEAFHVAERERGRALIDSILESNLDLASVPAPLLARARDLRAQVATASLRLAAANQQQRDAAAAARRLLEQRLVEYREAETEMLTAIPAYAALVAPPALSAAQIQQQLLDDDTALIRFVLGEPHRPAHAWLLTATSLEYAELGQTSEIERVARRVVDAIADRPNAGDVSDSRAAFERDAALLGRLLLGPFASRLGTRKLWIVSDGILQYVPFAALPEPGLSPPRPLVMRHDLTMLPSASVLALLDGRARGNGVAVIADPVYESDDPRLEGTALRRPRTDEADVGAVLNAGRLPFTQREGEFVLQWAPPADRTAAFGFDANRDDLLSRLGGRRQRLLHIAAHAIADVEQSELSSVLVSMYDRSGRALDGRLRLTDFGGNGLQADLIVLSACSTTIGKDVPGEGLMGFARGLLTTGATSTVVGSLFPVSDETQATVMLMRAFHEALLGRRLGPAAALAAAQRRMIEAGVEPRAWSSFVVMGRPE